MSQLKPATSRHDGGSTGRAALTRLFEPFSPAGPVDPMPPVEPGGPAEPAGAFSPHQFWWDRLTPAEQAHTTACVEADDVDARMLDILRCSGPVGPYGVRWAGARAAFLLGSFVDFVRSR